MPDENSAPLFAPALPDDTQAVTPPAAEVAAVAPVEAVAAPAVEEAPVAASPEPEAPAASEPAQEAPAAEVSAEPVAEEALPEPPNSPPPSLDPTVAPAAAPGLEAHVQLVGDLTQANAALAVARDAAESKVRELEGKVADMAEQLAQHATAGVAAGASWLEGMINHIAGEVEKRLKQ
jgi:hypothetical protein